MGNILSFKYHTFKHCRHLTTVKILTDFRVRFFHKSIFHKFSMIQSDLDVGYLFVVEFCNSLHSNLSF